ncbi:RagB/SusD family nutrient uptake outer membrane protein [Niabella ginsengisoli]|uniref:RagB/SusD family nutrient uptake outer membrane protein n=1 Tax=Niabella ginsengisoli TaxID=522298 RepID=A0ABS9SJ40_9BACT|nr:RagB/SusD family nutrient uptake outer membrane protein [Niabella ginsengisoli]MCH5598388.1 RagB/SusD family nutrient uptake outer membrane protein [Niabella ginsengisoli]
MKIVKIYCTLVMLIGICSCSKDFLNKLPKDKLIPETAFVDYNNFKTYGWSLYEQFGGYGGAIPNAMQSDLISDNMNETRPGNMSPYAYQTKIIPASGNNTVTQVVAQWNFAYIRKGNIMLDHIETSKLAEPDKLHWRAVGYFFRALRYYDLIASFGDVPWVGRTLSDTAAILFQPRTPRDEVARHVLDDLLYAEQHIKADGDGANTINKNVVRALISRFGLFEGTWRKYHSLSGAATYLEAAKLASEKLMASFPALIPVYDDVFNSEDLSGKPGIILFKQYAPNLITHSNPRFVGSTSWYYDLTKDAVESYLCTDGNRSPQVPFMQAMPICLLNSGTGTGDCISP